MWYPEGLEFKNIPCLPGTTLFTHFGVVLADPKNMDSHILDKVCGEGKPDGPLGFSTRPGELSSFTDVTEVYSTTEAMETYLTGPDYATGPENPQLYAAIVFHKLPPSGKSRARGAWDYSIRLNYTLFDPYGLHVDVASTNVQPITPAWQHGVISLTNQDVYTGTGTKHSDAAFMTLQLLVDRYIIGERLELGATCHSPLPGLDALGTDCALLTPEGLSLTVGSGDRVPTFAVGSALSAKASPCNTTTLTACAKCLKLDPPPECAAIAAECLHCAPTDNPW